MEGKFTEKGERELQSGPERDIIPLAGQMCRTPTGRGKGKRTGTSEPSLTETGN